MDIRNRRIHTTVTLLQAVTVIIALAGTLGAVCLTQLGAELLPMAAASALHTAYVVVGFATVAAVSAGTYVALYQFFRLCQRLKQGTAFTRCNERALRLIALSLGVCGLLLALVLVFSVAVDLVLGWLEMLLLFSVGYLGAALCAWALHLLLQRAVAMQEEADLTI